MKNLFAVSLKKNFTIGMASCLIFLVSPTLFSKDSIQKPAAKRTYPIVHTGVVRAYDDKTSIDIPKKGEPFFGQDANVLYNIPSYRNNGDGTISDLVTGLIWQQDVGEKMTADEAKAKLALLNGGADKDWRIPTIKELFSLSLYSGRVFGENVIEPFINTSYFSQPKGNASMGEREIDAQTWSSNEYTGLTMNNDSSRFGMNFVDGRIKSYPVINKRKGSDTKMYYRFVRGNPEYGKNRFHDNSDGTISDEATGLMWQKADSSRAMDWKEALEYADSLKLAGKSDWRVPSIKELQSIVDYTRSLKATSSAAIDPMFSCSSITNPDGLKNYPYYWSATTLLDGPQPGNQAAYVCFGIATAKMRDRIIDAHGAGAVRSDPKSGNIADYPKFFGPQGDLLSVYNYVRCVRTMK